MNQTNQINEMDEIDLWAYLEVLWKRKVLIFAVTILCAILAAIWSFSMPKAYRAELVLSIGKVANTGTGSLESKGGLESMNNLVALVGNRSFLNTVIQKNDLKVEGRLLKPGSLRVKADSQKDTDLVKIQVEGSSPEQAVQIVNAIAGEVIQRHKTKFDMVLEIATRKEKDLRLQIPTIENEIKETRKMLASIVKNPGVNAPIVILLKAGLAEREERLVALGQKLSELELANSPVGSENTRVLDPAIVELIPSKKRRTVALATFAGFMVGVFGAFMQESYIRRKNQA